MLNAERANLQRAFLFACGSGHDDVVEFLLENGADLRDQAGTREALLHWAVMGGRVSTIELLIEHGASREERNGYGGTPLGLALWSFMHDPTIDHVPTIEALLAAGGELEDGTLEWIERQEERSANEKTRLIDVLRRHGARRRELGVANGCELEPCSDVAPRSRFVQTDGCVRASQLLDSPPVSRSLASLEPRDHGGDAAVQEKCDCIEHMEIAVEKRTNGEPKRDAYGIHRICRTT